MCLEVVLRLFKSWRIRHKHYGVNLRGFHLEKFYFQDTDLRAFAFQDAILKEANFQGAWLQGVNLEGANLRGANLQAANLRGANLKGAKLNGAQVHKANLQEAELYSAEGVTLDILRDTRNWRLAFYSEEQLSILELPSNHNRLLHARDLSKVNLQSANLQYADLEGFNLKGTNLQEADLSGAQLQGANLQGAHFLEARGLSRDMLLGARNWFLAFYSENLFFDAIEHNKRVSDKDLSGYTLLSGYPLDGLNFQDADLRDFKLKGTSLVQANLRDANLEKAALPEAQLQKCDLRGAQLQNANLEGANLWSALLTGAKLSGATLHTTKLREASLQDADLSNATGLIAGELAGTIISNALLPGAIRDFDALSQVEEASKNARSLFIIMLLASAYVWLTLATTTDAKILTHASSPLPIIQTAVPLVHIFVVAPFVLVSLYLYFHLYLQRLWDSLADLPAVFPDGRPLDKIAYPWLLNILVRTNFFHLRQKLPLLSKVEAWFSIILVWWVVPVTIIACWLRYMPQHYWVITTVHVVVLAISIQVGIWTYRYAVFTLRGGPYYETSFADVTILYSHDAKLFNLGRRLKYIQRRCLFGFVICVMFLSLLSYFALEPMSPLGKAFVGYGRISLVNADLRNGDFSGMILRGADFRNAKLQGANLENADVQKADFRGVKGLTANDIRKARNWILALYDKDMLNRLGLRSDHNERIDKKKLRNAKLFDVNLQAADLEGFDLRGANLERSNLQAVSLRDANLQGANLMETWGLTKNCSLKEGLQLSIKCMFSSPQKVLGEAKNWPLAFYSKDLLAILSFPSNHNERIRKRDLSYYALQAANVRDGDFQGYTFYFADLRRADLRGANLLNTNFKSANLQGADLRGTKGLTRDILHRAKNWPLAFYSEDLLAALSFPPNHNERISASKDLSSYDLQGVNFEDADLSNTKLTGANMTDAILNRAKLCGTDLSGAIGLTSEQILSATIDKNTRLPSYLQLDRGKLIAPPPAPLKQNFSNSTADVCRR